MCGVMARRPQRGRGVSAAWYRTAARLLVEQKFGPLPVWAATRLKGAKPEQIALWTRKVLNAGALEGVIGRK